MTLKNIKYVTRHIIEKGIHLTPMTRVVPVNIDSNCNYSTQFDCQLNVLHVVTQLHLGGTHEN